MPPSVKKEPQDVSSYRVSSYSGSSAKLLKCGSCCSGPFLFSLVGEVVVAVPGVIVVQNASAPAIRDQHVPQIKLIVRAVRQIDVGLKLIWGTRRRVRNKTEPNLKLSGDPLEIAPYQAQLHGSVACRPSWLPPNEMAGVKAAR